ncbi:MAG: CBU_0592 family membrane protein [Alphaproteobacteria bacterium]
MDLFFTLLGILGAFLCIFMFFLLARGTIDQKDIKYYLGNGVGALCVLIAVLYDFDKGDSGAVLQEACWISISLLGTVTHFRKRRAL